MQLQQPEPEPGKPGLLARLDNETLTTPTGMQAISQWASWKAVGSEITGVTVSEASSNW